MSDVPKNRIFEKVTKNALHAIIIVIVVAWLIFACQWYTARCSEFVTKADSLNVTLPEGWTASDYKGCDKDPTNITAADDTIIHFGLNTFTHLDKDGTNYVYKYA